MILAAFWSGDLSPVEPYLADDVAEGFRRAIAERSATGLSVDQRVLAVDAARIMAAQLEGQMAEIAVEIEARIAGVTRDREGRIVAGSPAEPARAKDEWTFRRHVGAIDPNWLLVATAAHETAIG